MLTERAQAAINLARETILKDPYDEGHNVFHHTLVYQNCLQIINAEKLENIDEEALLVAAMWHDWQRPNNLEEVNKFREDLKNIFVESDIDEEFFERVWEIIAHHSFGEEQQSIEQKVLFDADKLEYLNIERFIGIIFLAREGNFSMERVEKYKAAFANRIPIVKNSLNFEYSKIIFQERIAMLLDMFSGGEYPEVDSLAHVLRSLL